MRSRLNAWYLDDGTSGDTVKVTKEDLNSVMAMRREIGLELYLAKCGCSVFAGDAVSQEEVRAAVQRLAPDIPFPHPGGAVTAGRTTKAGGHSHCHERQNCHLMFVRHIMLCLLAGRLDILPAQQALFILRNCLSAPKTITNTAMMPGVWRQATLPVGKGGQDIRKTSVLAYPAYQTSVHTSRDLIAIIASSADLDYIWRHATDADSPK
ncbi:hypothetical protein BV898_04321 [Hypsibius exemplaris]|uniref:Uncharacterized protein n=1 Tax=Hypsibius exemplaris TaxID=2072580 RepID=A0A1W0X2M2_HYPEX|nr:hypothetical protein BV898_04321 [Hypsibius exemplaris]